ncbi:hypothetical protein SO802_010377 [Lithocarpus litseifolius]|uniref:Uncharacterized protein n=1 Tax=Lithocarpus litseifolius TaxID=425828 RepID=A0AAW2DI94_9ROSI
MKKKKKTNPYPAHTNREEEDRKQTEMVLIAVSGLVLIAGGLGCRGSGSPSQVWVAVGLDCRRRSLIAASETGKRCRRRNSSVGNDSLGGGIGRISLGFPLTLRVRDLLPAMVIAGGNFVGIGFESSMIVFHGRESLGDCLVAEKALGKKVSNLTLC